MIHMHAALCRGGYKEKKGREGSNHATLVGEDTVAAYQVLTRNGCSEGLHLEDISNDLFRFLFSVPAG